MTRACLLSGITTTPCSPTSHLHLAFHGASGNGGRVGATRVPADYRNITLDNSPVRGAQPGIYEKLDSYAETFKRQFGEGKAQAERIKSMYLWSASPGTGKTTTAAALLHAYLITNFAGSIQRGIQPKQRPAFMLDAHQLQTEYNAFNRPRVPEHIAEPASARYYTAIEHGKYTDFVVIDDVATRSASEAFVADLHSVVNYRVANAMPTVYTSNLPVKELPRVFGEERLADRIGDQCGVLHFEGESKRGRRR